MSAVVIQDQVDFQIRGYRLLQLAEEDHKLAASMPGQALTDDFAGEDVKGSKQRGGAVPDIVVRLALGQAGSQGQDRRRSVQGLNLALFIDAEHQRLLRRVQV